MMYNMCYIQNLTVGAVQSVLLHHHVRFYCDSLNSCRHVTFNYHPP